MSRLRGRHLRARRLVFSTVPFFCHGEEGSQNQVWVPISAAMPELITHLPFQPGDLVACACPFSDGQNKTRICAIVAAFPETGEVVVVYGTSNLRFNADAALALTVSRDADCQAAGLHKRTRFQVDRRIRLHISDRRFSVHAAKGTAKVGQLSPAMTRTLAEIYRHLPPVSAAVERQGIHPVIRGARGRSRGLRRPPAVPARPGVAC